MALTVLGLGMKSPVEIKDAEAISISFPEFVTTLKELGGRDRGKRAANPQDRQAI